MTGCRSGLKIANAVKNAREMALLPYTKRVSQTRAGRPPRDRDEDGGGRGGREGREDGGGRGGRDAFKADTVVPDLVPEVDSIDVDVDTDDETVEA